MTKTLTEAECHALTVRGDVPGVLAPGILVEMDWCESDGETEETRRVSGVVVANLPNEHGDARVLWYSMDPRIGTDNRAAMFLRVPVVGNEAHLVGWLGRGERCPACKGSRCQSSRIAFDPDDPCDTCDGLGHLRVPHNCYPWLTPEAHGGLPDWIRMALIWGSVVRAAAGMEPLRGFDVQWDADLPTSRDGLALIDGTPTGPVIRFEAPDADL